MSCELVRKDVDVNERERISNFIFGHKLKYNPQLKNMVSMLHKKYK
jgi:hypothetical protein